MKTYSKPNKLLEKKKSVPWIQHYILQISIVCFQQLTSTSTRNHHMKSYLTAQARHDTLAIFYYLRHRHKLDIICVPSTAHIGRR